jgi:hypothetical protein
VADENVDCDLEAGIAWQFYRNTYLGAQTAKLVAMSRHRWFDKREINYDKRPPATYD